MLHRDIKPGNILLASGSVKVADFGIAKTPGAAHTTTGQIVGTLAYLSPERLAGEPASIADDLYAAGVVGYEALTGRKPFPQEDIAPLARAIVEEQPPPLAILRPDVEPSLAKVIERAMSREQSHRFPSADTMRAVLIRSGRTDAGVHCANQSARAAIHQGAGDAACTVSHIRGHTLRSSADTKPRPKSGWAPPLYWSP